MMRKLSIAVVIAFSSPVAAQASDEGSDRYGDALHCVAVSQHVSVFAKALNDTYYVNEPSEFLTDQIARANRLHQRYMVALAFEKRYSGKTYDDVSADTAEAFASLNQAYEQMDFRDGESRMEYFNSQLEKLDVCQANI